MMQARARSTRNRKLWGAAVLVVAGLFAVDARAELEFRLGLANRSVVATRIGSEIPPVTYELELPANARLNVAVRPTGPRSQRLRDVDFRLLHPDGSLLTMGKLRRGKARLRRFRVPVSGTYRLQLVADGAQMGHVRLAVKWKVKRKWRQTLIVPAGGGSVAFAAPAGSGADLKVRGVDRAAAVPRLAGVSYETTDEDVASFDSDPGRKQHREQASLPFTGDYTVDVRSGEEVPTEVSAVVRLDVPKVPRTSIDLLDLSEDAGSLRERFAPGPVLLATVGPGGGSLPADAAGVAPSLVIPEGAVGEHVAFAMGAAPAIDPAPDGLRAAGQAVYFTPDAVTFSTSLTVVLPFERAAVRDADDLVVAHRDVSGTVTVIDAGLTIDWERAHVSFETARLGTFAAHVPDVPRFSATATLSLGVEWGTFPYNGQRLCVSGDTVACGSPFTRKEDSFYSIGRVQMVARGRDGWSAGQTIDPSDATAYVFGSTVVLEGDTMLVGDVGDTEHGSFSGAVHVYVREDGVWRRQARLQPHDPAVGRRFGSALALDGDRAFVSAPMGPETAAVYVFERTGTTWTQVRRIVPEVPSNFGWSLAYDDGLLAVGAWGSLGHVAVYSTDTWERLAILDRGGAPDDRRSGFATSLAMHGDLIAVGDAAAYSGTPLASGSVIVFRRDGTTWTREAQLTPEEGVGQLLMGYSVAVHDGAIAAGAQAPMSPASSPGGLVCVYEMIDGTWTRTQRLLPDGDDFFRFGESVSMDEWTLAVSPVSSGKLTLIE